jgi:hypothetical protein
LNYAKLNDDILKRLLLLSPPPFLQGAASSVRSLPVHDWGIFGEYEYLGAGTPYSAKQRAGVLPRNEIDRIAEYHDSQYSWTGQHVRPHSRILSSGMRGVADYGAGAAMMTAAFNPFSDLSFNERILGFVAGDVLMIQGLMRLNPATWLGMVFLDWLVY